MIIPQESYEALMDAKIVCDHVPDSWAFVDGSLTRWNNLIEGLKQGTLSFGSIKVGLRRFADLTALLRGYEQSNT